MVLLRLLGFIVLLIVGGSGGMYLFTRDRRWLRFAGQVLRLAVVVAAVFMAGYLFERLVLIL